MSNSVVNVWSNQVDKKYDCRVERDPNDSHKGVLKLELNGVSLKSKEVTISYGGPFGPDAGDVNEWCGQCIEWVDAIEAEEKKPK